MRKISKRKITIIIICIVTSLALLLGAVYVGWVVSLGDGTITKISAKSGGDDTILLKFKYSSATGGYSARNVLIDEGEYTGDGMRKYDGSLGKYRIIVEFGDIHLSSACRSKLMLKGNTIKVNGVTLKIKLAYPSDHGVVIYFGSDAPISVEEGIGASLNGLGGTVSVPIKIN
jgi:hypothetical protein